MNRYFILIIFIFFPLLILSQELPETGEKLTHWLTPGELLRLDEIGKGFVETEPPAIPIRNIAEFDRMQGALIRYPFGIPMALIKDLAENVTLTTIVANLNQKNTVLQQYINNGVDTSHCNFLTAPTETYWTRDYGPWFISYNTDSVGIVDFPYNRPRPNDDEIPKKVAQMLGIPWFGMNLVHTGGNYMADGLWSASSTELVWEENPTLTPIQVDEKVKNYLGIDNYHVRADPNGTYIDHIDCWSKFLAPDKILVRKVPPTHSQYQLIEQAASYWASTPCPYGYNYKVYRVNTPNDQPYTNSLILNNIVLMPFMNSTLDDSAKAVYQAALPGYDVIGFLGSPGAPWESTDALHCRVMGVADIGILYIRHIPLAAIQPCEQDYVIQADIIACSHQPLKQDSVLIYYSINGGSFQTAALTHLSGVQYEGIIPAQPAGSNVSYYLFAADESQRRETCPFIGPANPFTFSTVYTDITVEPDTLWFITPDDALNGKRVRISNYSSTEKTVVHIDSAGPFWWVEPWPLTTLPHMMAPGDTLGMTVFVPVVTDHNPGGFYVDTMNITSSLYNHPVILMINEELISNRPGDVETQHLRITGFPNPFRNVTSLRFLMDLPGPVVITITDLQGKTVRSFPERRLDAGLQTVQWDGRDNNGNLLPSGIYIIRAVTERETTTCRIVIIR